MRSMMWMALLALSASACIGSSPFGPSDSVPRPVAAQVLPSPAVVGDVMTITGRGFTPTDNSVRIGAGYVNKLPAVNSTTIRFTLPDYLEACPPGQQVCIALALPLPAGTYKVSVINANGTSNEVTLLVAEK